MAVRVEDGAPQGGNTLTKKGKVAHPNQTVTPVASGTLASVVIMPVADEPHPLSCFVLKAAPKLIVYYFFQCILMRVEPVFSQRRQESLLLLKMKRIQIGSRSSSMTSVGKNCISPMIRNNLRSSKAGPNASNRISLACWKAATLLARRAFQIIGQVQHCSLRAPGVDALENTPQK